MLKRTVAPSTYPVTLAEAKAFLRVTHALDDAVITGMIAAATDRAETIMARAIMPQTWMLLQDSFTSANMAVGYCPPISLERPLVTAIGSIKYYDVDGVDTTLDPSKYFLTANEYSAIVSPIYNTDWPNCRIMAGSVRITFVCGWADAPPAIKGWILLCIGSLYEIRQQWTIGEEVKENSHIDRLLDCYRIYTV